MIRSVRPIDSFVKVILSQRSQAQVEESGYLQEMIIVSASELLRLREQLFRGFNLAMVDGQNAARPHDVAAGHFR